MTISRAEFKEHLRSFNFHELFLSLGWDNVKYQNKLKIDDTNYNLKGIVQKRGFLILTCVSENDFPDTNTRKKIERQVSKLFYEHLIIYHDNKTKQIWQLSRRLPNKPIQVREFAYYNHQEPEFLYQKIGGLLFTLDEEKKLSLVDVKQRISEEFNQNAEKVTKKFYQEFTKEHSAFQKFIEGLEDKSDIDWYTSLMLNRLMFIYFIQKKGFLDSNPNYLAEKLKASVEKKGEDKFYKSFYRSFLLTLFHKGLGNPQHDKKLLDEIGKVPYLNGGLFDVHELEKDNEKLDIKDKAFERLFKFFDEFNWHLDTSITATGRDINPDVIGYIFEKYINDRASMGAYYTKEDITEYIGKNTIIPFLFDKTKKECANAFKDESSLWQMLKDNPDKYIYDAVKHGIHSHSESDLSDEESQKQIRELPPEIRQGINPEIQKRIVKDVQNNPPELLELRKEWNKPAPSEYGLPTEIWREVVERRERYFEIKKKIENGEIREINDFITYNLNITQFAQDAVENYEGSDFINAFYNAIKNVTILDPTCGSGAFLFAALNILEPLYETCIKRMREFVEIDDTTGTGKKHQNFRKVLADIEQHPNEKYYIYKSIILNNLYGVDIMKEAVEIAKLRLFLKLVAEVEPDNKDENYGLEPLPDIDFNIRSGNTLVGYATEEELDKGLTWSFDFDSDKEKLHEKMDVVARAFKRYKEIQLEEGVTEYKEFKNAKDDLINRLAELNDSLNDYLAKDYGIIRDKEKKKYEKWLQAHIPFHWFAEFYEIINGKGGFDAVIGNPPYIEYPKVKNTYKIIRAQSLECNNLWAFVIEKTLKIIKDDSQLGIIVPMSLSSSKRMRPIQKILNNAGLLWVSNFESGSNPGQLFIGVKQNLSILFCKKSITKKIITTKFLRFFIEERASIFERIRYHLNESSKYLEYGFPKIGFSTQSKIFEKLFSHDPMYTKMEKTGGNNLYVHRIASYYIKCFDFIPYFRNDRDGKKRSEDYKVYYFGKTVDSFVAGINSSIFYMYWQVLFDNFKAGRLSIEMFPFPDMNSKNTQTNLKYLCKELMNDMQNNAKRIKVEYQATGNVEYDNFYPRLSKHIIDEIDKVLAEHYGFTEEELDFVINYDIKYRMGKELNNEDEEEN